MAYKVVVKINKILYDYDLSLRQLSRLTNIRHATLSELSNQKRDNINFSQLERIANELDIEDMREIMTFEKRSE